MMMFFVAFFLVFTSLLKKRANVRISALEITFFHSQNSKVAGHDLKKNLDCLPVLSQNKFDQVNHGV